MTREGVKKQKTSARSKKRQEKTQDETPSGILISPPSLPRKGQKQTELSPGLAKELRQQHNVPLAEREEVLERFRASIRDGKASKIESESQEGEGCAMSVITPNGHRVILIFQKVQGKLTVRLPDIE